MAEQKQKPPYASATDVAQLFERMRNIGDPGTIDTKWVESYGIATSQPEGIVGALKWLGVFDQTGKSTGVWNELRQPAKRSQVLRGLIETAYAEVFTQVEVAEASRQDLEGAFIAAYDSGSTNRPIGCFLALCRVAEIETPGVKRTVKVPTKTAAGTGAKAKPKKTGSESSTVIKDRQPRRGAADSEGVAVALTLNVEIPADWTDEQVRGRIESVRAAIEGN